MKIPKWFIKWFNAYGNGKQIYLDTDHSIAKSTAWRAYQKGKRDGYQRAQDEYDAGTAQLGSDGEWR